MSYHKPQHIAELTVEMGYKKATLPLGELLVLGFLGGAFIAIGFLLDIRIVATMPAEWGSFAGFIGASVFPVGLILVVIAGGELLTGNMMAVPLAWMAGRVKAHHVLKNWLLITFTNFAGAVFVAFFFGHILGLTESGAFLTKTVDLVAHKLDESFLQAFISGIGCNWLVALAVWLAYGSDDIGGKVLAIWFPTMAFVAIGFQHVVANMFLIPAAIFAGYYNWSDYLHNFVPVFLGNAAGGTIFVAGIYWVAYLKKALVSK
jgi:formate/nitrite transporter